MANTFSSLNFIGLRATEIDNSSESAIHLTISLIFNLYSERKRQWKERKQTKLTTIPLKLFVFYEESQRYKTWYLLKEIAI